MYNKLIKIKIKKLIILTSVDVIFCFNVVIMNT